MKIQKALGPTGKAIGWECFMDRYAMLDAYGALYWYQRNNGRQIGLVTLDTILKVNWQPYHEIKEIRPEKAGELWKQERGFTAFTFDGMGGLKIINDNGAQEYVSECDKMIHGKNGWKRVDPLVLTEEEMKAEIRRMLNPEDDSIERIEIEGVNFIEDLNICIPTSTLGQFSNASFLKFVGKGPMKMILEIPKEPHECQG